MTVVMELMNWTVFIHVLTTSSGALLAGAFQVTGLVMETMTVETSVMKLNQIAPKVSVLYSPPNFQ